MTPSIALVVYLVGVSVFVILAGVFKEEIVHADAVPAAMVACAIWPIAILLIALAFVIWGLLNIGYSLRKKIDKGMKK